MRIKSATYDRYRSCWYSGLSYIKDKSKINIFCPNIRSSFKLGFTPQKSLKWSINFINKCINFFLMHLRFLNLRTCPICNIIWDLLTLVHFGLGSQRLTQWLWKHDSPKCELWSKQNFPQFKIYTKHMGCPTFISFWCTSQSEALPELMDP